jgi:integrase
MRVKLKGLNSVNKKLADGSRVTYWYAWKGGPRLNGQPGSPEFVASYNEAVKQKLPTQQMTLLTLMQKYQASTDFTDLAGRTKRDYVRMIKVIESEFGDMPLKLLSDVRTRVEFMEWRDELAKLSAKKADYCWKVLSLMLAWSKNRGHIAINPCERGGTVYHGTRVDKVWSDDEETVFLGTAPEFRMDLPLLLACWTGQRQGDLIRLPWSAYDGSYLYLKPSKSKRKGRPGKPLKIPVGAPLKAVIDATERVSPLILTSSLGKPWTESGFQKAWKRAIKKAGIVDRTFHDLRGTAITRLGQLGVAIPDIAALTGHSLATVHNILQAHYLHLDVTMAERAVHALERRTKLPTELPTGPFRRSSG